MLGAPLARFGSPVGDPRTNACPVCGLSTNTSLRNTLIPYKTVVGTLRGPGDRSPPPLRGHRGRRRHRCQAPAGLSVLPYLVAIGEAIAVGIRPGRVRPIDADFVAIAQPIAVRVGVAGSVPAACSSPFVSPSPSGSARPSRSPGGQGRTAPQSRRAGHPHPCRAGAGRYPDAVGSPRPSPSVSTKTSVTRPTIVPPPLASKRTRPLLIRADEPSMSHKNPRRDVVAHHEFRRAVEANGGGGTN